MERPAKLERLAAQRDMLGHAIRGLDGDIELAHHELESIRHGIDEAIKSDLIRETDARYRSMTEECELQAAQVAKLRQRRADAAVDLNAMQATVAKLEAWCRDRGIGAKVRQVRS